MLLYLSTNTCPDIAYTVSQGAHFSTTPKKSHAQAVKHVVCYLARIINKGTIFHPTTQYKLDCYVDADFMGLHGCEHQDNPMSAKSSTGYIINFGGCPLIWKSQLQTEVVLSTSMLNMWPYLKLYAKCCGFNICSPKLTLSLLFQLQFLPSMQKSLKITMLPSFLQLSNV